MDPIEQKAFADHLRYCLSQIALELAGAGQGAQQAGEALPDRDAAWSALQQMYTRLEQANHLAERFKADVAAGIERGVLRPRAPAAAPSTEGKTP